MVLTLRRRPVGLVGVCFVCALVIGTVGGCAGAHAGQPAGGKVRVAAIEATWGSLAAQIGGDAADVVSIVSGPGADPHDFEPRPRDAVTLAQAQLVIVNGAGYDAWAEHLLDATRTAGRVVVNVADLLQAPKGANPHFWYSPRAVSAVIARITSALAELDPGHASTYTANRKQLETVGLADYHRLLNELRTQHRGTAIGISETLFEPLAAAIGLQVVTPTSFASAVSAGTDPTAADRATITAQIREHRFAVFLENTQSSTPDVEALAASCRRAGIPVVEMTETPAPAGATFQAWQVRQLEQLAAALARPRPQGPS
jgi:zinc/manganese transport system substrate-binding protein